MWRVILMAFLATTAGAGEAGFQRIFNGRDLTGWDGKSGLWSVQDGMLRGESHGLTLGNTFLIWRGGTLKNFDLRLQYRLHNGNSGVQYRAREIGKWVVAGYQAEIANEPAKAGFLYEERGRKFLVPLGQSVTIATNGRQTVASLGLPADYLRWGHSKPADWNSYEIVAVGPYVAHYLNGFRTAELWDAEEGRAASEGVLALQIHAGGPMTIEFKDISLKNFGTPRQP